MEWFEIARALGAETLTFDKACSAIGPLFARVFSKKPHLGSSIGAFLRRSEFDTIYITAEGLGIRLAPLLRIAGWSGRIVMVVHACISTKRKLAFKALGHSHFAKLVCVSEETRRILVDEVGFPSEKVVFHPNWVDTQFFSVALLEDKASSPEPDYVFSCGLENRDYITLTRAASTLPYPFKIVASGFLGRYGATAEISAANVTVHEARVSYLELRRLYAKCRFVVVPLNPVRYAAGVTGLVEAMSMGKAVVVTASPGINEYVEHGVSGLVVRPYDPDDLARAISELWDHPERCEEMGRRNRAWVESHAALEGYVRQVEGFMAGSPSG
jgi:glycosyltransferase involved in cell wall biosynthesis